MINHFTKLLFHFYWSHVIKKVKQAIHTYVSIQCFTCCITLLLSYTCHITTILPCFQVWEFHVTFTCNPVRNKQNRRMFHMYVSGKMTWWDRWCTCLWDEMQLVEAKHRGCYKYKSLSPCVYHRVPANADTPPNKSPSRVLPWRVAGGKTSTGIIILFS